MPSTMRTPQKKKQISRTLLFTQPCGRSKVAYIRSRIKVALYVYNNGGPRDIGCSVSLFSKPLGSIYLLCIQVLIFADLENGLLRAQRWIHKTHEDTCVINTRVMYQTAKIMLLRDVRKCHGFHSLATKDIRGRYCHGHYIHEVARRCGAVFCELSMCACDPAYLPRGVKLALVIHVVSHDTRPLCICICMQNLNAKRGVLIQFGETVKETNNEKKKKNLRTVQCE